MLFLALRHLTSRKRQTLLTLLGILLGTCAYVVISGMMMGFQTFMVDQLINNDSHIRISAREELITPSSLNHAFYSNETVIHWVVQPSGRRDNSFIEYAQGWFEKLDRNVEVLAYSPQLVTQVIAKRAKITTGAKLIGSDPTKQLRVTNIESSMREGKFKDIGQSGNRIVVGDLLLKNLGGRVSEMIYLSVGKGSPVPFKVIGSFHLGIKSIDEGVIFGSLNDTQKLNQTPSRISDIAVRLIDVNQARTLALNWDTLSEDKVQSWDQANEGTLSVFKTQDIVRNSMTISILIVASFGIYNILNMAVTQKRREIAILRSIGFEPREIVRLFLVQGMILGLIGGLTGIVLGYWICIGLGTMEVSPDRTIGGGHMLMSYHPMIYVRGFLIAFFSAAIASFLPARAAGKLTPIDIIRGEA